MYFSRHVLNSYLVFALCFIASTNLALGRTGIPEIDSLPTDDWKVQIPELSYKKALIYSALIPGGGQLYGKHNIRAGFLIAGESLLYLSAFTGKQTLFKKKNNAIRTHLDSAQTLFEALMRNPESASLYDQYKQQVHIARNNLDIKMKNLDVRRGEIIWATGLHFYGIMDALEIVHRSKPNPHKTLSSKTAFWRALLIPGAGQLYNKKYGKFGLLWMGIGGSIASAWARQEMVKYFQKRLETVRLENSPSKDILEQKNNTIIYRKRRNQFFWGIAVLHFYSIGDAVVDAILNDFDHPDKFALSPGSSPLSLNLSYRF